MAICYYLAMVVSRDILPSLIFTGHDRRQAALRVRDDSIAPAQATSSLRLRADLKTPPRELVEAARAEFIRQLSNPETLIRTTDTPKDQPVLERYPEPKIIKLTNDQNANRKILAGLDSHVISITSDSIEMRGYLNFGEKMTLLHVANLDDPQGILMRHSPLPELSKLCNATILDYGTCA